ncbi:MAG: ABC transporter ATP-binding protein [Actinomycetota bacterium]|nr:ABC transporter ATP-binding protein [Actinomycetota bacterium]
MTSIKGGRYSRSGLPVKFENVARNFKDVAALKSFNLDAEPGELIVLLGPSGCGKTTALRVLAGLEMPDSGRVIIGDHDVTSLPSAKRNIGMVFQSYSLFPNMTAKENVEFGLRVRGQSQSDRSTRSGELLELVGLKSQSDRYPHQLSGGQQQRVALARALAVQPEVLVLDEPLSALDAKVRSNLRDEIRRIQLELGITTFFVTHDQEEALAIADRIAVMHQGQLEQLDTPLAVYTNPATEFVAEFVGTVNRLPGRIVDSSHVDVHNVGLVEYKSDSSFATGSEVEVLVRPESIGIREGSDAGCRILAKSFLGSTIKITLLDRTDRLISVAIPTSDAALVEGVDAVNLYSRGQALLVKGK